LHKHGIHNDHPAHDVYSRAKFNSLLEGKRPSFEQPSGPLLLRIENLESAGGAALQRISLH
jgi:hypothetical protein